MGFYYPLYIYISSLVPDFTQHIAQCTPHDRCATAVIFHFRDADAAASLAPVDLVQISNSSTLNNAIPDKVHTLF